MWVGAKHPASGDERALRQEPCIPMFTVGASSGGGQELGFGPWGSPEARPGPGSSLQSPVRGPLIWLAFLSLLLFSFPLFK